MKDENGNEILFITNVGSHMWKMNRPDSDVDLFKCYRAPSRDFLIGRSHTGCHFSQKDKVDTQGSEIGKVVEMILKNNCNFLWGVMSPIVVFPEDYHGWIVLSKLRDLTRINRSKLCYHSVHGLVLHNLKKMEKQDSGVTEKQYGTLIRTIKFGIALLDGRDFIFAPVTVKTRDELEKGMRMLDDSYSSSKLPEKPEHEKEMLDWLYQIRVDRLVDDDPERFVRK